MKFHELKAGAYKGKKRVGRGTGSGHGKTAGRGTKGQNARSGGGVRPGFEGGQNPLMKRLPKSRGFKSQKTPYEIVHTDELNRFKANTTVTKAELKTAGIISSEASKVKILRRGKLEKSLTVTLEAASATAVSEITDAGGKFEKVR